MTLRLSLQGRKCLIHSRFTFQISHLVIIQFEEPPRTFVGLRPTLMGTKKLYENGLNPFFSCFFNLMGTRMVQIRIAKSV